MCGCSRRVDSEPHEIADGRASPAWEAAISCGSKDAEQFHYFVPSSEN